ncbi:MAG TPA: hypothetical protein VFZ61_32425 [Polyangiales bacterium]
MKRSLMAIGLCGILAGCSGSRTNTTNNLRTGSRDAGEARDDASPGEEPAGSDGDPDGEGDDAGDDATQDTGERDAAAELDAQSSADAEADADVQQDAGASPEGWGPDGPRPDAGDSAVADTGADAAVAPAETYSVDTDPSAGELPEGVASAAAAAVSTEELGLAGARAFEVAASGAVRPEDALLADQSGAGLTATLLIEWGYLPGMTPPAAPEWRDLSGYVAVGDGSIELVRPVRFHGPAEPGGPRPAVDGVAPQTDPRLVRFRSFIGTGHDGLLVRLKRTAIKPAVVALSVAGVVHYHTFEHFLAMRGESGGWAIPYGQVGTLCTISPSTGCFVRTGTLSGSFTLRSSPNTALAGFSGEIARDDGARTPLTLQGGTALSGPYGALTGMLGSAPASGYFGRDWLFSNYTDDGIVVGMLGAAGGSAQELFTGVYDRTQLRGATVFRSAACDEAGATRASPFRF